MISARKVDDVIVLSFDIKEVGTDTDRDVLAHEMGSAIEGQASPKVVVNLDGVAYMSSMPIGVLVGFAKRVKDAGGDVCLCCVADYVHETFRAAKLHHFLDMHVSEEEALSALSESKGEGE